MKKIIIAFAMVSAGVFAKEDCSLESLDFDESTYIAEQLFYTGTCHYRNKEYAEAVANWEKLLVIENYDPDYEELKIDVLNNLGYMMFFGYGTERNQQKAMDFWRQAILMGHYEAEYHLCHAYADKDELTYNLNKARQHCKKALLVYKGMEDPNQEILDDINRYLEKIGL